MERPTAIDLFSGGGGFSLGLSNAGFEVLFGADNWEPAIAAYEKNLGHKCHLLDLSEESSISKLKEILDGASLDVIVGGPPCQGVSSLGAKDDSDPRNGLFRSFVSIVKELKPRFFIMENVTGLTVSRSDPSSQPVRAKDVCERFVDAGYPDTSIHRVRCDNYGVPQIRKRIFFIGSYGGGIDFLLPPPCINDGKTTTVADAIFDLPKLEARESSMEYATGPSTDFQRLMRGDSAVLHNHSAPNHDQELVDIMSKVPDGGSRKSIPELGWNPVWHHNAYSRLLSTAPATAVSTNLRKPSSNRSTHPTQNRGLTIREGLRLQTFPDSYVLEGGVVDQSIIVGNSVPPLLAQRLFEPLANLLRQGMPAN